jgi:hypothetical protein
MRFFTAENSDFSKIKKYVIPRPSGKQFKLKKHRSLEEKTQNTKRRSHGNLIVNTKLVWNKPQTSYRVGTNTENVYSSS